MKKLTKEEFIKKAIAVHGNEYDYSLVNYCGSRKNVDIVCKKHGIFSQNSKHHIDKASKCPLCRNEKLSKQFASTTDEFINKAIRIHKDVYDYSNIKYVNAKTKVLIECKKHGIFLQKPSNHLSGAGCPSCKESVGEKNVAEILMKNNIQFERQVTFNDLKNKSNLFYDFYLPKHKLFIEYDGIQHYKQVPFFGGENTLNETRKRDIIKYKYAINNGYKLIKIPYSILGTIKEALECELKNLLII